MSVHEQCSLISIYWYDLTLEKQEEILEALGNNGNYDVLPIATIELQLDEEKE